MNPQEFDARYLEITKYQRPVLNGFLQGDSDAEIATRIGSTPANVRQHLRKICQIFGIGNLPGESERYRHDLVDLFIDRKPELVADTWKQKLSIEQPQISINYPSGAVPLDRGAYIERGSIETEIEKYISEPRALIRVLAPSKFGKTSLCFRIKAYAQAQGYRAVYINLKQSFDRDSLNSFEIFLQHFCNLISEELDLSSDNSWNNNLVPRSNCDRHIEKILKQSETPLLLILDGVESVYTADNVNQNFFQMLRSWHDKGADSQKEQWKKIRQLIVYSSENYGKLDLARSPFNIGRFRELTEFDESNILELAKKYGLNWDRDRSSELRSLVGGHPYLVNLALYHFASDREFTLDRLFSETQDYLCSLTDLLQRNSELKLALQNSIDSSAGIFRLERQHKWVLYSMGVIKEENSRVGIRCKLYDRYFQNYFALESEE
ncbi:AAA-like domain-containing protein [Chamaesiphon polymorphus]|uniref:HTH luxR-type domain-containing protein n=1 Tax=Chamaesiphon polymorphus CCALA 037 TaxID=2107692 RepID=A0A2T1GI94_9CYAN|nr:AAA-like domain-containing protein [Chamaesiphon polymorphus]PSB57453.1 hypothetical protein C7B77_08340 [Chamaesiphon polymorphus CCALA 037]